MRPMSERNSQNTNLGSAAMRAANKPQPSSKKLKSLIQSNSTTGDSNEPLVPLLNIEGLLQIVKLVENFDHTEDVSTKDSPGT